MANTRLLLIAAIIIILVSVVTIYLVPSDTIIPIPSPNENSTRNGNNINTPSQDSLSQGPP
ncbi:MAG: hypothetical protein WBL68_15895 [Nitrososphaeraceae archaeon]